MRAAIRSRLVLTGAPSSRLGARVRACPGRLHRIDGLPPQCPDGATSEYLESGPSRFDHARIRLARKLSRGLVCSSATAIVPFVGAIAFIAGTASDSTLVLIDLVVIGSRIDVRARGRQRTTRRTTSCSISSVAVRRSAPRDARAGPCRELSRDDTRRGERHLPADRIAATRRCNRRKCRFTMRAVHARASFARPVSVPRFDDGTSRHRFLHFARGHARRDRSYRRSSLNPRATAVYGRDSVALFYVEELRISLDHGRRRRVQVRVIGR